MNKVRYLFTVVAFACLLMAGNCKKGGGSTPNEASLIVELNPAAGGNQAPAPGPDFPLTVTVKSTMPGSGVKIDVNARQDVTGSTVFFFQSINTMIATTNFTITNSPSNLTLRVNVTVTSLTNANNKWTGSYTYSRK